MFTFCSKSAKIIFKGGRLNSVDSEIGLLILGAVPLLIVVATFRMIFTKGRIWSDIS